MTAKLTQGMGAMSSREVKAHGGHVGLQEDATTLWMEVLFVRNGLSHWNYAGLELTT